MKPSPDKVLNSKTPRQAAFNFAAYLVDNDFAKTKDVVVWSPEETKRRGWGSGWAVCWESGSPFEWAPSVCGGSSLFAAELGNYGLPGDFPNGLSGSTWFAEPYNGFILNFYEK